MDNPQLNLFTYVSGKPDHLMLVKTNLRKFLTFDDSELTFGLQVTSMV